MPKLRLAIGDWEERTRELLKISLLCAVPLWIGRVRRWPIERRVERARAAAQIIAEKGDVLMFRAGKKGESAEAFNRLAESLACLSFNPGGVTFLGVHFEEKPRTG